MSNIWFATHWWKDSQDWSDLKPPIVNINKKRSPKNAEVVLRCNNGGFPRYVDNQLKIFVPVGKDIKIVTPVK